MSEKQILVVCHERGATSTRALRALLRPIGRTRVVTDTRMPRALGRTPYDFVVIDSGASRRVLSLLGDLKRRLRGAAVVVVKSDASWKDARQLLVAGAVDVITDPSATIAGVNKLTASLQVLSQASDRRLLRRP